MNSNRSSLWLGGALVLVGTVMLVDKFTHGAISWLCSWSALLTVGGLILIIRSIVTSRPNQVFPGMLAFMSGLLLVLDNFPFFIDLFWSIRIPTFVFFVLFSAFLAHFLFRKGDLGLLVPTLLFAALFAGSLLFDLNILNWEHIKHWWPIVLVLVGLVMVLHGVGTREPHRQKSNSEIDAN